MYSKYLLSVIALIALFGFGFAQTPYCCGSPIGGFFPDFLSCVYNCNEGCYVCDLDDFGFSCAGYYGYQYSCPIDNDNDGNGLDDLDIDVVSDCEGNTVIITDNGHPISGADVTIVEDISGDPVASGSTNSDGEFDFPGCPDNSHLKVEIEASKNGYSDEDRVVTLVDCSQCVLAQCGNNVVEDGEQCDGSNNACSASQSCNSDCQCAPVQCGACQVVDNHQCKDLCGAGQTCVDNACKDDHECTTDLQCDPDQFCNIPPGQNGGSCKDLCEDGSNQCQCSNAVDHKLVPTGFECGFPGCENCPSGTQCVDHKCVASDLSCPSTGIVGDEKTCDATDCPNCNYEVTLPDGKKVTGQTDDNGDFDLPLNLEGIYKVTLFKDGVPVKTVEIRAFPQAPPEEPEKPTGTGGDPFSLLWLLILLLLVVLGIVYWRSRQQKK